ncbi:MAG: aldo/keto reductase [Solirubrobacteraceae bacterium]
MTPGELRIGLGCMRLPADERLALDTIVAAASAGITVFDTAHAYGADGAGLGHNELLLARGLRAVGRQRSARIVTKGGMTRPNGCVGAGWPREGNRS